METDKNASLWSFAKVSMTVSHEPKHNFIEKWWVKTLKIFARLDDLNHSRTYDAS